MYLAGGGGFASLRKHGQGPYGVVVLHGGPGAAGEVAPVAKELAKYSGVLEPFQTATTVTGQLEELKIKILKNAQAPVVVIGYSWGAWLGWMLAASCPDLVQKLILVSSGVFEAQYAERLLEVRKSRLLSEEQVEVDQLIIQLQAEQGTDDVLARFGYLMSKADGYDTEGDTELVACDMSIFQGVWPEAAKLRASGELLALGKKITCPVLAIHGNYDPSPAAGVEKPLAGVLGEFKFILLNNCGHTPWKEKFARDRFYEVLQAEVIACR